MLSIKEILWYQTEIVKLREENTRNEELISHMQMLIEKGNIQPSQDFMEHLKNEAKANYQRIRDLSALIFEAESAPCFYLVVEDDFQCQEEYNLFTTKESAVEAIIESICNMLEDWNYQALTEEETDIIKKELQESNHYRYVDEYGEAEMDYDIEEVYVTK